MRPIATKSIFKNINIETEQTARIFVEASERASNNQHMVIQSTVQHTELTEESEIRDFFKKEGR